MRLNALALMAALAASTSAYADDGKQLGRFTPGNDDTDLVHHRGYYGGGFRGYYGYYRPAVSFYYGPAYYPAPVYYAPSYYYAPPVYAYPRVYIGISGGAAPTVNLALRPAAATSSDPAQMQLTMPTPYTTPSFRYDGGPANPVPMPVPDRNAQPVPQPQAVPATDVQVSLPAPAVKPALRYPAYGDK